MIPGTLFQHRWAIRIVAAIAEQQGSRFTVLKHQLGVSADSLSTSLSRLIEQGWIEKNPGYGHPLRPEYILSTAGHSISADCVTFVHTTQQWHAVVYRRWSTSALVAIQNGASRFGEIQNQIQAVTPRALALGLRNLAGVNLIEREAEDRLPQRAEYMLTRTGRTVARVARPLVLIG
ncbi:MAG: hypothetical protein GKR90_10475 [Pseudomonadales bacterium]|nr:hypothetical protein [Pseudomonadales bacterium]